MRPIVTDAVAWSVSLSVTVVSHAKTAEPIEMSFGLWTRVGQRNRVLDGAQIPHAKGKFWGERAVHCKLQYTGTSVVSCAMFGMRRRGWSQAMKMGYRAYWCQLANTTEPCMCGGDAVLWRKLHWSLIHLVTVTLFFELRLDTVKMNQNDTYLGHSKVI